MKPLTPNQIDAVLLEKYASRPSWSLALTLTCVAALVVGVVAYDVAETWTVAGFCGKCEGNTTAPAVCRTQGQLARYVCTANGWEPVNHNKAY